jgi:hypothetical protein
MLKPDWLGGIVDLAGKERKHFFVSHAIQPAPP